jgi:hypothetical protein
MQDERYAEACAKFAESQRLDPAGGTLLNLAVCHEAEGKTASAWAEFQEAFAMARADGRQDRMDLASEHIAALEARLSKIVVDVTRDPPEGLKVSINSAGVGAAGWGSEVPVDPGAVEVKAVAPGYAPFVENVHIAEGEELTVTIPPLAHEVADADADLPVDEADSGDKTAAYVVGAVGVAALGVGSYFGVRALQQKKEADNNGCDADSCSTARGHKADENAVFNGWLSTAGFAAGVAALGVATYLLVADDSEDNAAHDASRTADVPCQYAVVPGFGREGAAVWFSASF